MDVMEWSPLMHAARNGHLETVQELLKSKEKINSKNLMGADLLMLAAASGNKSVFKIILEEMKNTSTDNSVDLSFALRVAALFGHTDIVQFILNAKCDPNAKDAMSGATALMLATSCRHYSVVRILLAYGALVDDKNVFYQSAIDIAESKQYNDIVKLLKQKITYDSKKFRPNLIIPLQMPQNDYKVKELVSVSCSPNLYQNRAASPTANGYSCATEELLSPKTTYTPDFSKTSHLSPVTLLPMSDCATFSPGNCVFLSDNERCKRTVDDKGKKAASQSTNTVEIGCSSNDIPHYLSPQNYLSSRIYEIPKKQDFSREIQKEMFQNNLELPFNKVFQYDSCSQPSSPYSPSPTSRNVFSRSDPSVIHELNGGTEQQKGRKKAFWHGIRRRVRSLAHYKNGYHFYHPYCDTAVSQNCVSSPHIWTEDLKTKTTEAESEREKDNSACKIVISPRSSTPGCETSHKNRTKLIQKERPHQSDFKEFLCANGLQHFTNIFLEQELDLVTFFELHDMDLREIGIKSREDRKRILSVIASQSHYSA